MSNEIPEDDWEDMIDKAHQHLPRHDQSYIQLNWYTNDKDVPEQLIEQCIIDAYERVSQFTDFETEFQAKVEEYLID